MTRIVARRWRGWIWAGIGAFLVVGGLIWLWIVATGSGASGGSDAGMGPVARSRPPASGPAPARTVAPVLAAPTVGSAPSSRDHHTADPCTALLDPVVPERFEMLTIRGITIAWSPAAAVDPSPFDAAPRPVVLAYLVGGLLDEAARLTGTDPRDQLAVVVYPTREELVADTQAAPQWASGLYDGGAVRMAAAPSDDVGVDFSTLRHEVMHAQLHAGVGCMPAWFNEGLAMYFGAGTPPLHEWFSMLREPPGFALSVLEESALDDPSVKRARILYAQSLAMFVFLLERGAGGEVMAAVAAVRQAQRISPLAARALWHQLYPDLAPHVALDHLAMKLFGVAPGRELDRILDGAICCHGLGTVGELGCRGVPVPEPPPKPGYWIDRTTERRAVCKLTW